MANFESQLTQARSFIAAGEIRKADTVCLSILSQSADHPEALMLRGICAREEGDYERSVDLLHTALACNSEDFAVNYNLGIALVASDQLAEAYHYLIKSHQLNPDFSLALIELGLLMSKWEHDEKALILFDRALEIDINNYKAWHNKGTIFLKRQQWLNP